MENTSLKIPQILTLAKVTKTGKINLRKKVRQHIDLIENSKLFLFIGKEISISTKKQKNGIELILEKNGVFLPEDVLKMMLLDQERLVGLVERERAIAIKTFELKEKDGEQAKWYDIETPTKITRWLETNPEPEIFLKRLSERNQDLKLNYDVHSFLNHNQTLDGLLARRLLAIEESSDKDLHQQLIQERLDKQNKNGSWESKVQITAKNLRELAELGLTAKNQQIKKSVDWLLDRPQSKYNPGLWFATDGLVQEQEEIIQRRKQHTGRGTKERFNQSKSCEENLVRAGDPIIENPCGARIMWTSALVLEALLIFGIEKEQRVQTALKTLLTNPHWCDNTYQHGFSTWKRQKPLTKADLEKIERYIKFVYKYGGVSRLESFKYSEVFEWFNRISITKTSESEKYFLKMPLGDGEGCRVFMVRALSSLKNKQLKKLVDINIWQFAANLNITNEIIQKTSAQHLTDETIFFLQIFSRSNLTVAKLVIARMLSWLVKIQNEDGSWGKEPIKEATTRAVLEALVSLGNYLPMKIHFQLVGIYKT